MVGVLFITDLQYALVAIGNATSHSLRQ